MQEVSTVRASAGRAGRSKANRPTSSAAMCWASAALPPLPKRRILFLALSEEMRRVATLAIADRACEFLSNDRFAAIDAAMVLLMRDSKSGTGFIAPLQGRAGRQTRTLAFFAACLPAKSFSAIFAVNSYKRK